MSISPRWNFIIVRTKRILISLILTNLMSKEDKFKKAGIWLMSSPLYLCVMSIFCVSLFEIFFIV